jgi:L-2-hydroxyglutarate oxidase
VTDDFCVLGGGILGVATAMRLLELRPGAGVVLLEKERRLAAHQSGHNSGVIHAGVYYEPGSLKARFCRAGAQATKELCDRHGVPYRVPGKLLVATDERELAQLAGLRQRARANRIDVEVLGAEDLAEREPNVTGLGALLVPSTGVVDYTAVTAAMSRAVEAAGGRIELGARVTGIRETAAAVTVVAGDRSWTARQLVVCGGLQADRLARMSGLGTDFQIVPFRGEYFRLRPGLRDVVRHLVYPVPDPALPFLGVHVTTTVAGDVLVGPNAVLSLAREGYRRLSADARDVAEYAAFPGLWRVARRHWRTGAREVRDSLWTRGYLAQCRRYLPGLSVDDLETRESGVRAQAVLRDGTLVHDFLLRETSRTVHVCNAPSPAATSALPIADHLARILLARS